MPAEELLEKAASSYMTKMYNIDGYFFTEQPEETFKNGRQTKVPLLIGWNSTEVPITFLLGKNPMTIASVKKAITPRFGKDTEKVMEAYGLKTDADVTGLPGARLAADMFVGFATWKWCDMHEKTGGQPVYRYLYCHPRPAMRNADMVPGLAGGVQKKTEENKNALTVTGAVHSSDIEYAMGNLPTNRVYDWQPEDFTVSEIFQGFYLNFVKTGNPNGLGLPEWTPINGQQTPSVMQIDVNSYMKSDAQLENIYHTVDSVIWK